jgi:hypothetical protein
VHGVLAVQWMILTPFTDKKIENCTESNNYFVDRQQYWESGFAKSIEVTTATSSFARECNFDDTPYSLCTCASPATRHGTASKQKQRCAGFPP